MMGCFGKTYFKILGIWIAMISSIGISMFIVGSIAHALGIGPLGPAIWGVTMMLMITGAMAYSECKE